MIRWRTLRFRLRAFFQKRRLDAEMDEEMRLHLELREERHREAGLSAEAARYAARREFGGVEQLKEHARDQRSGRWFEHLVRDARISCRGLARRPSFAFVAIGTLALGIGATSAIFSVVEAFLLRPLPFPEPRHLVAVRCEMAGAGRNSVGVSVPEFEELRDRAGVFDELSISWPMHGNLTGSAQPHRVEAMAVSGNYFRLLGASAAIGRTFGPEEEKATGWAEGCVLSHAAWQRYFGGDAGVLGRKIWLDYDTYRVVGVMPPDFRHPGRVLAEEVDVWLAFGLRAAPFTSQPDRARRLIPAMIGRLKASVTPESAAARLAALAGELRQEFPKDYPTGATWAPQVEPLHRNLVGNIRPVLWLLFGAVALLLAICCATLANLLLVRALARRQELAVRRAIGASRAMLARQLCVESVLLAVAGGAAGLLLAHALPPLLLELAPANLPQVNPPRVNGTVLGFTFGLSLATGLLFGLVPAWQGSKFDLVASLKRRGGDRANPRWRAVFAASQVALSLVVLVGAGLLAKSFWRALNVSPGFQPQQVVVAQIWLPPPSDPKANQSYRQLAHRTVFVRELLRRMRQFPGVTHAAIGSGPCIPLAGDGNALPFAIDGAAPGTAMPAALLANVSPDYFRALEIPLIRGRGLAELDDGGARSVVVNAAAAARFWPGEDPLGRRIVLGSGANAQPYTIVGIVGSVKTAGLDAPDVPQLYFSIYQRSGMGLTVFVRSEHGAEALLAPIVREVQALDRDLPVFGVRPLTEVVARSLAPRRFAAVIVGAFALLSLGLAAVGLYGVIALTVAQRTQEIGVRLALGAQRRQILALIMGGGLRVTAAGIAVGLAGALAATQTMRGMLFETTPIDAATFGGIVVVLAGVALLASWLPARRAARVDPVAAMRAE